jgi:hypothetical protein
MQNQTIEITVNYITYKLFQGNLGIDETVTPNIWKLHFSAPLYPGNYDVEARVIDVTNNIIVVSDNVYGELTITRPQPASLQARSQNLTIPQKVALVAGLLNAVSKLPGSGGNSGVGGNPSVHPVIDDDCTTSQPGRADNEREYDPRVKDKDTRQKPNKIPKEYYDLGGEADGQGPSHGARAGCAGEWQHALLHGRSLERRSLWHAEV